MSGLIITLSLSITTGMLPPFSIAKQACADWPTGRFDDSVSGGDSEALSCLANLLWWPVPNSATI
jgi:hypothetical protein